MNPPFFRPCGGRDRRGGPRRGACKLAGVEPANDAVMNQQLVELKLEHRDLDLAIARLQADIQADELTVKRMKRSEEHTSELQSLMRISYAVFCLKKKRRKTDTNTT